LSHDVLLFLSTWDGQAEEHTIESKGPVEADNKNDAAGYAAGIEAGITTKGTLAVSKPVRNGSHKHKMTTHLFPVYPCPSPPPRAPAVKERPVFHLKVYREAMAVW
jgi:hypothetical protein